MARMLCISTAGSGQDPVRVRRLTDDLDLSCTYHDFDRSKSRWANARNLWAKLRSQSWDLVYQEGTGIAGGLPLIRAARAWGQQYVVSSGDPVGGYFQVVKGPLHGFAFEQYEKALYRHSAGFIGWTPYLSGMALKMGAPCAATVEGAVDLSVFSSCSPQGRRALKSEYGLNPDHLVCGLVGSLTWYPRQQYCYGLELIEMLPFIDRSDVSILLVGDGDGRSRLAARVPDDWSDRVVFTGQVPEEEVVRTLNAMDVGFISQTLDDLGPYRLTTKLPEYLACGLPVAMSPIPGFFDYAQSAGWSLPAAHPSSAEFHRGCAALINKLSQEEITTRRQQAPKLARKFFSYESVRPKFESFLHHVLQESGDNIPDNSRDAR